MLDATPASSKYGESFAVKLAAQSKAMWASSDVALDGLSRFATRATAAGGVASKHCPALAALCWPVMESLIGVLRYLQEHWTSIEAQSKQDVSRIRVHMSEYG